MNEDLPLLASGISVDLSNCDLEPIHIPSSIQPQGLLIAARSSDQRIVYVSENSVEILGVAPTSILEQTLAQLLGPESVASIEKALGHSEYLPNISLTLDFVVSGAARFDVVAHRAGGLLCIEFEPVSEPIDPDFLPTRMEEAIHQLGRPKTIQGLCTVVPALIRELTGYDRVMVYRFDRDGHGEIVAEDKAPEMEPFLGLHYPATDIPRQARKLYLSQRVRAIFDVGYRPVGVLANRKLTDGVPLDMTYCALRSVSPIHIEYLKNMGVGATFGVSLIVEKKLWGMILCHHRSKKHLAPAIRSFCDLFGQLASLLIVVTQQAYDSSERLQKKAAVESLRAAMEGAHSVSIALEENVNAVLALLGADGMCLRLGDETLLVGKTPTLSEVSETMSALRSTSHDGLACSDHIGSIFPSLAYLAPVLSGAVMVPFKELADSVIWMRTEVAQTVHWAGNPHDAKQGFQEGSVRLSPRKSFATWQEVQRGRSLPWRAVETEAAVDLARVISEKHLQNQLAREQLLKEKRVEALSHMAAGLAHEINNPLAIIHGTASNLLDSASEDLPLPAPDVRKASNIIVKTSDRAIRILRALKGFARESPAEPMEWASVREMAESSFELQQARFEHERVNLRLEVESDLPLLLCRKTQIEQILSNLLNNAFDSITQNDCEERWVYLKAECRGGNTQIDVVDSGPGLDEEAVAHIMQPFFTTKSEGLGMGIGLSLSLAIAQDHGGSLTFCQDMDHTCFRLTMPSGTDAQADPSRSNAGVLLETQ